MIPELFAYTMNFSIVKFLHAQSKIMVVVVISAVELVLLTVFNWLLKLGWGLVGVIMEGLPQPLELCAVVPRLCCHALVSDSPS
ncbi:hypothetical protein SAY87_004821 [Trapa incisa]|uniref:Uncharacterized protein n=1 Tax=Trapa incisa TaxID=236973 RepID=A0AAN7PN95_9MYRT|nr:hypothetical protein SAY87_004821 [Trapa incisa]